MSREVEEKLGEWLGAKPPPKPDMRLEARKKELAKLEAKLWDQVQAIVPTVKRLKSARKSVVALKRARRAAKKRPQP